MKRPAGWIATLVVALTSCQPLSTGAGDLGLRVAFPAAASFRTQVIPVTTARIDVTVSGEGLTSPNRATLTPSTPSLIMRLPVGPKTVSVVAFDAAGKAVAQGTATATVPQNAKATAIVSLSPTPEASPSPSAEPSGQPSPGTSGDPNQPQPTTSSSPTTSVSPSPTTSAEPPAVPPTTTTQPGGGGGGGALATPTPVPSATVNATVTVTDGNPNPPLNFTP